MRQQIYSLLALLIITSSAQNSFATIIIPPTTTSSIPEPAKVSTSVNEFNNLSAKEKRAKVKEVKKEIKSFKVAKKAGQEPSTNTLLLVILAILLPPLAVYLHQGEINNKFWISLVLTLLFFVPGVIYALIVVLGKD